MINLRTYGESPFHIAVIHGGPGVSGTMAPVARELSSEWGILEPLQTAKTLQGQILELNDVLKKSGDPPIILVGFSWGAMLSYIFSATYPQMIQKLILISSAVYEEVYAESMAKTRLKRFNSEEREEVHLLMGVLNNPKMRNKNESFSRLGELMTKADVCDPLTLDIEVLECQYDIFQHVWNDAQQLRMSGKLLKLGKHIRCPVVAIHGDYDPHPAEGVRKPLASVLPDFQFICLKNCGHIPWIERKAKESFFKILTNQIAGQLSEFMKKDL